MIFANSATSLYGIMNISELDIKKVDFNFPCNLFGIAKLPKVPDYYKGNFCMHLYSN